MGPCGAVTANDAPALVHRCDVQARTSSHVVAVLGDITPGAANSTEFLGGETASAGVIRSKPCTKPTYPSSPVGARPPEPYPAGAVCRTLPLVGVAT